MIDCVECGARATHVLVDYEHNPVDQDGNRLNGFFGGTGEPEVTYCFHHAFTDGREQCHICEGYDYHIKVEDTSTGERVNLLPTYPAGTLNSQGCCSDHP